MENIEQHNYKVSRQLFEKAGELGLLGIEVPEDYGGFELGKAVSGLVAEKWVTLVRLAFLLIYTLVSVHCLTYIMERKSKKKIFTENRIGRMDWGLCFNRAKCWFGCIKCKTSAVLNEEEQLGS